MRIKPLSDLHMELMTPSQRRRFVGSIPNDCDVLVLAGDIDNASRLRGTLDIFARRFENIVYVPGNHEFYGHHVSDALREIERATEYRDAIHYLWCSAARIGPHDQRFLGTTLWFADAPAPEQPDLRSGMADFAAIRDFEPWVYLENERARLWFDANVRAGDVVVTHHLPSPRSVHPKYRGSPFNRFFLGCMTLELENLIVDRKPALWIHGHTHESMDCLIGDTRVVCNPYGYHGGSTNSRFDPGLVIEIGEAP